MPGKTEIDGVEIEWINHSSVKLKNNLTIFIDVFEDALADRNEEKGDLFLSTHDHFDHYDATMINMLARENSEAVIFKGSDESDLDIAAKKVSPGEEVEVKGVKIEALHAYNREKDYHPKGEGVGYLFDFEGKKFYYSGDTDFIPEMKDLEPIEIDVAFLPIGGTYTMDRKEAVKAVLTINPKIVIPTHYDFIDKTAADEEKFKEEVESQSDIEVRVL